MGKHARSFGGLGIKVVCAVIWNELLVLECVFKQHKTPTIAGNLLQEAPDGFFYNVTDVKQPPLKQKTHFVLWFTCGSFIFKII